MLHKLSGWDDTIVALATAPGVAALGVIRLSGNKAIDIVDSLFPSKELNKQPTHTIHVGFIRADGKDIDEVVISLFKNPKSYTGEDVVEISCHGSPYVQQQVLQACISKGARLAKAGEFTQRAFLNGKLDLTQAEAVADLISSNTAASQKAALHNIRGGFSDTLKELRENIIQFSALIELELDFSEEDVEFANRDKFYKLIQSAEQTTSDLLQSFKLGNAIKHGVSIAIIGDPNAGKSTLLNMLLNEDRAIVSDIPGTTRDTIEEVININGILFRLIDTAGIRENAVDTIENIGVGKSLEKRSSADVVLYLYDVNTYTKEQLQKTIVAFYKEHIRFILVGNKIDISNIEQVKTKFTTIDSLFIAAKQGTGISELKEAIFHTAIQQELSSEDTIITNSRHYDALQSVEKSLLAIKAGLDNKLSGDLLVPDIHQGLHYLSEITGDISNETVLDYIFSKFCIGK
jgi:tRNA modification GTPase